MRKEKYSKTYMALNNLKQLEKELLEKSKGYYQLGGKALHLAVDSLQCFCAFDFFHLVEKTYSNLS